MVRSDDFPRRIPQLYAEVRQFRQDLDAPDILERGRVYETILHYIQVFTDEHLYEVADELVRYSPRVHGLAVEIFNAVKVAYDAVTIGGFAPNDMNWKRPARDNIKAALDAFLAIPDPSTANGGRRRKTRKTKRRRYTRRR
jgi:hypothetical protein